MNPLVSTVIPCFNSAATAARAIDSALDQDYSPHQVIVVDDASTDGTADAVEARYGDRVTLIRLATNAGASAARNAGIEAARGDFLAFLDSDDKWLPGKLSAQMAVFEKSPAAALVSCDCRFFMEGCATPETSHRRKPPVEGAEAWKTLLAYNFLPTPTVVARRDRLAAAGGFRPSLKVAEDLDLWIRLAKSGEVRVVDQVLVEVFDRPNSLMKRYSDEGHQVVRDLVESYIGQWGGELSPPRIRAIRGERTFAMAADLFYKRAYLKSVAPFCRAAGLGYRPVKSLFNIPRAIAYGLLAGILDS